MPCIIRTLTLVLILGLPALLQAETQRPVTVPFGDQIDDRVLNYNRLRRGIATSGELREGALDLLATHGFARILDLRTPPEGTAAEQVAVEQAGMAYYNIPLGGELPDQTALGQFASILEDTSSGPLLVHCRSANRVGVLWALHQINNGVPVDLAIEEGLAIGMSDDREQQIRASLK